jgi:hypothetical protein
MQTPEQISRYKDLRHATWPAYPASDAHPERGSSPLQSLEGCDDAEARNLPAGQTRVDRHP